MEESISDLQRELIQDMAETPSTSDLYVLIGFHAKAKALKDVEAQLRRKIHSVRKPS